MLIEAESVMHRNRFTGIREESAKRTGDGQQLAVSMVLFTRTLCSFLLLCFLLYSLCSLFFAPKSFIKIYFRVHTLHT